MKILFCSSTFSTVTHGPAKFARYLFQVNKSLDSNEIRILTEASIQEDHDLIHSLEIRCPRPLHAFRSFFKMIRYFLEARRIKKKIGFDVIVFNHALDGFLTALMWRNKVPVIVMLNDYENLMINRKTILQVPIRKWIIRRVFKFFECHSVKLACRTIVNSRFLYEKVTGEYSFRKESLRLLYKGIRIEDYPYRLVQNKIDFSSYIVDCE